MYIRVYTPFLVFFLFFFLLLLFSSSFFPFYRIFFSPANISIAAKPWQPMSDERTAALMNRL